MLQQIHGSMVAIRHESATWSRAHFITAALTPSNVRKIEVDVVHRTSRGWRKFNVFSFEKIRRYEFDTPRAVFLGDGNSSWLIFKATMYPPSPQLSQNTMTTDELISPGIYRILVAKFGSRPGALTRHGAKDVTLLPPSEGRDHNQEVIRRFSTNSIIRRSPALLVACLLC